jgi:hypothetical protein
MTILSNKFPRKLSLGAFFAAAVEVLAAGSVKLFCGSDEFCAGLSANMCKLFSSWSQIFWVWLPVLLVFCSFVFVIVFVMRSFSDF